MFHMYLYVLKCCPCWNSQYSQYNYPSKFVSAVKETHTGVMSGVHITSCYICYICIIYLLISRSIEILILLNISKNKEFESFSFILLPLFTCVCFLPHLTFTFRPLSPLLQLTMYHVLMLLYYRHCFYVIFVILGAKYLCGDRYIWASPVFYLYTAS